MRKLIEIFCFVALLVISLSGFVRAGTAISFPLIASHGTSEWLKEKNGWDLFLLLPCYACSENSLPKKIKGMMVWTDRKAFAEYQGKYGLGPFTATFSKIVNREQICYPTMEEHERCKSIKEKIGCEGIDLKVFGDAEFRVAVYKIDDNFKLANSNYSFAVAFDENDQFSAAWEDVRNSWDPGTLTFTSETEKVKHKITQVDGNRGIYTFLKTYKGETCQRTVEYFYPMWENWIDPPNDPAEEAEYLKENRCGTVLHPGDVYP